MKLFRGGHLCIAAAFAVLVFEGASGFDQNQQNVPLFATVKNTGEGFQASAALPESVMTTKHLLHQRGGSSSSVVALPKVDHRTQQTSKQKEEDKLTPLQTTLLKLSKGWTACTYPIFAFLCLLPLICGYSVKDMAAAWYCPVFSIIAATLPSGGAPVAGGIVLFPALKRAGLQTKQAVAYCAAAQMIGCGVFAPLNWAAAAGPRVLLGDVVPWALVPGVIGAVAALLLVPLDSRKIELFFAHFCVLLAGYVVHGLSHDLTTNNEPVKLSNKTKGMLATASFVGGLITGWIGIGIEKILFVMLTSYPCKTDVKKACLTSISIVGWVSLFATLVHAFILKDVPVLFWLMCLPGGFIGSKIGPKINRKLGPKNIMKVFTVLLLADSGPKVVKTWKSVFFS